MRKYFIIACLVALAAFTGIARAASISNGTINTLHANEFAELFGNGNKLNKPVVIDVSAQWCGWCIKMHPHLEELAEKYEGQIYFFQINYETDLDLINDLGISSFPTLIYIRPNSTVVLDEKGFRTAQQLDQTLQEVFFDQDQASWPTTSWPETDLASWPATSWPENDLASWPTTSWPENDLASWPTQSWPMI